MTDQHPIPSGFTAASTAAQVSHGVDLTGKIAVVTGGYSGIGVETVRALATAGARVIVPARDVDRARLELDDIANVEVRAMDLLDPTSIDEFAGEITTSGKPLHILVNSAGIMALPERRTDARGYEQQFATNHLGHFQLTTRLAPALRSAGRARVVSVSSWGHRFSPIRFDDIHYDQRAYDPWTAYGQSKTANILFAVELDRRWRSAGVRAFAVHPGNIETNLGRHISRDILKAAGSYDADGRRIIDPARALKTVEQGAATSVWCAASPQLEGFGGVYCENNDIAAIDPSDPSRKWTISDSQTVTGVMPYAIDPEASARLWQVSERMIGGV